MHFAGASLSEGPLPGALRVARLLRESCTLQAGVHQANAVVGCICTSKKRIRLTFRRAAVLPGAQQGYVYLLDFVALPDVHPDAKKVLAKPPAAKRQRNFPALLLGVRRLDQGVNV